ncbi:hypothetical protein PsorP6_005775 [Peronosclerospora sorghi]|uniref:Uncharacterized protein n=1 Tax=Peronosclerospora sorghi TaxID=230839 RepID=A0ACC0W6F8_9STRA|nr:hypothetical protein PsorP6_005775 [Peronosclerospora sorghi]
MMKAHLTKIENAIKISNVNYYDVVETNAPFGVFKDSGIGSENGELGLRNYLEQKTVIIKRSINSMP